MESGDCREQTPALGVSNLRRQRRQSAFHKLLDRSILGGLSYPSPRATISAIASFQIIPALPLPPGMCTCWCRCKCRLPAPGCGCSRRSLSQATSHTLEFALCCDTVRPILFLPCLADNCLTACDHVAIRVSNSAVRSLSAARSAFTNCTGSSGGRPMNRHALSPALRARSGAKAYTT